MITPFKSVLAVLFMGCITVSVHASEIQQSQIEQEEAYAYALGIHAYTFGFPWVYLTQLRYLWTQVDPGNDSTPYAPVNTFFHTTHLADAKYRSGGSPNNDTLYSIAWVDVTDEPVILSHPEINDRYFTFELASMDSDNFAYAGLRETGPKAGNFAIVGPDWEGELPAGVQELPASRTNTVLILGRTLVDGPEDVENVVKITRQNQLTPLSQWGKDGPVQVEAKPVLLPFDRKKDPLADWKTMNAAMTENPPEARHSDLLDQFATIHVGPNQHVEDASESTKRGLTRAARDGLMLLNKVIANGMGKSVNGWTYPPAEMGRAGDVNSFLTRAAIQCLTGIIANEPIEATYLNTWTDAEGQVLHGDQRYIVRFASDGLPPINNLGFWSMTLYGTDYNFIGNPIDRYSVGNRTKGLTLDADGSLTLSIQSNKPEGDETANWLPSPAGRNFYLVLRTYLPKAEIVAQTWAPPALERAE
jgi:hypothetical protein